MIPLFIALASYLVAFVLFVVRLFTARHLHALPYTFLTGGLIFYAIALVERFTEYRTFPIGDIYGTLSFIGNLSVLIFILLSRKYNFEVFGGIVSFMAFLTTLLLIPSKKLGFSDPLYIFHLVTAVVSYAFIIFAGLISFSKLFVEKSLKEKSLSIPFAPLRILKHMEKFFIIGGFIGLTLTLVFGSLWAKDYLGTHWINDPKLLITLLLWLYYAFLSHMFVIKVFRPSQISYLSMLGTTMGLIALFFFRHSF
ncbi:MAG: cytochrome c biogenesis protein CcsA [Aquificae bacterium]|nr:cytochrome c biogenesis protein CcsA [Aquificota bacterium]